MVMVLQQGVISRFGAAIVPLPLRGMFFPGSSMSLLFCVCSQGHTGGWVGDIVYSDPNLPDVWYGMSCQWRRIFM